MFTRVLVPLDGSTNAAQAWPYGRLIAKAAGAELEILWIVESLVDRARHMTAATESDIDEVSSSGMLTFDNLTKAQERATNAAQAHLDEVADEAATEGTPVTTIVREGRPADVIIEAAGDQEGTLIVMGTHGRSGIARWVYGSVADRVIHHAATSTLVVRSKEGQQRPPEHITRVIVPLDGSQTSERAIPSAVEMAKALGVGITIIRALDLGIEGTIPVSDIGEPPIINTEEVRAQGESYVQSIADQVRGLGITDVVTKAVDERPAEAIIDEVGETGDKLVVMGSHGRSGAGRWLLGSIADNVVRHGTGPVLIVRRA